MKTLIIALTLALATPAVAQSTFTLPKTMKLYDNKTGHVLGTATQNGRTLYLRDLKQELVGSVTTGPDGKRTFYDPSGKQVDALTIMPPSE